MSINDLELSDSLNEVQEALGSPTETITSPGGGKNLRFGSTGVGLENEDITFISGQRLKIQDKVVPKNLSLRQFRQKYGVPESLESPHLAAEEYFVPVVGGNLIVYLHRGDIIGYALSSDTKVEE